MKNLQKLSDLYQQLTEIDKEIIKIEKIANKLLFENVTQEFTLTLNGASLEKKESIFDEDGSLKTESSLDPVRNAFSSMFTVRAWGSDDNKTESENQLKGNLSSKMAVLFIDMLLAEMNKKRDSIVRKANKLMKEKI